MNKKVVIGVVCLQRNTYDTAAATEIYEKTKAGLRADDSVCWEIVDKPVIEVSDAIATAKMLAGKDLDGIVIISGTFHLGHLALIFDKYLHCPILLWAFTELPYNNGKIRLNSVCGINLDASNLYKAGIGHYTCAIGDHIDRGWLDAVRICAKLREAHIGLLGYRADGFFNLDVEDLSIFHRHGILLDHYELSELASPADPARVADIDAYIHRRFALRGVTDRQTKLVSSMTASLEDFIQRNALDAVAIRCWPECANTFGVAPCAAMALLTAKGYTLGCEGDVEGTLSLLACRAVSNEAPFMADFSQVNMKEDYALMWHCGVASDTLWDQASELALDTYFANGRGVTTDFVMKSGVVTLFRIDTAHGKTRVFLQRATAQPMEKLLRGTYAKVVFEKPTNEVFTTIAENGIAHHLAMVYGDFTDAFTKYAKLNGFEVIQ